MVSLVVSLLLTAVFLKLVAAILPDLEIDGWGAAIGTAAIMRVAGVAVGFALSPLIAPFFGAGGWITFASSCVVTVVVLAIAAAVVPGVKARGVSVAVAGVLVEALNQGAYLAVRLVATSNILSELN